MLRVGVRAFAATHVLTVMDEFTREGLPMEAPRTTSAERVVEVVGAYSHRMGRPATYAATITQSS